MMKMMMMRRLLLLLLMMMMTVIIQRWRFSEKNFSFYHCCYTTFDKILQLLQLCLILETERLLPELTALLDEGGCVSAILRRDFWVCVVQVWGLVGGSLLFNSTWSVWSRGALRKQMPLCVQEPPHSA